MPPTSDGPAREPLERSLEPIAFLSASTNRVRALEALAEGAADRRDLEEAAALTRATLSRTLAAFEDRDWVVRTRGRYDLTPLGAFVARELGAFVDRMDVATALGEVVRWFPEAGFGFDLARLSAADVVRPSKEDPLAPTNNMVRRLAAARRARVLTYSVLPACLDASWRRVVDDEQRLEVVFEPAALDAIGADPTMAERAADLLGSESASVYRSADDLPHVLILADDVANLCLTGPDGSPRAVIDTDDEEVVAWAETCFATHRDAATPLGPDAFSG